MPDYRLVTSDYVTLHWDTSTKCKFYDLLHAVVRLSPVGVFEHPRRRFNVFDEIVNGQELKSDAFKQCAGFLQSGITVETHPADNSLHIHHCTLSA